MTREMADAMQPRKDDRAVTRGMKVPNSPRATDILEALIKAGKKVAERNDDADL